MSRPLAYFGTPGLHIRAENRQCIEISEIYVEGLKAILLVLSQPLYTSQMIVVDDHTEEAWSQKIVRKHPAGGYMQVPICQGHVTALGPL